MTDNDATPTDPVFALVMGLTSYIVTSDNLELPMRDTAFMTALPWLKWLPEDTRLDAIEEIFDSFLKASHTGRHEDLRENLAAWKATAEIHTDPERLAVLTDPLDPEDLIDALRPE